MIKEILLPNLGEGVDSADVSEILVKVGDIIEKDSSVLVLESEKATMEIPSDFSGTIKEIFINNSDKVTTGQKLISIEISEGNKDQAIKPKKNEAKESKPKEVKQKPEKVLEKPKQKVEPAAIKMINKAPFASPAVRRFARELGADINLVIGNWCERSNYKRRCTKIY